MKFGPAPSCGLIVNLRVCSVVGLLTASMKNLFKKSGRV